MKLGGQRQVKVGKEMHVVFDGQGFMRQGSTKI